MFPVTELVNIVFALHKQNVSSPLTSNGDLLALIT